MPNLTKKLDSGADLEVTMASFAESNLLRKAVMREVETVKVSFEGEGKALKDLFQMEMNDAAINTIKNMLMRLAASDSIEDALWPCLGRATYNRKKIDRDTFEDEAARGDYLVVAKEVLWFNLSPFFKNLGSMLSAIPQKS